MRNNCYFFYIVFLFFLSCAGAGTAADCDKTTDIISANVKLHALEVQKKVHIISLWVTSNPCFSILSTFF